MSHLKDIQRNNSLHIPTLHNPLLAIFCWGIMHNIALCLRKLNHLSLTHLMNFLLKYSWFTIFMFQVYSKVIWKNIYVCVYSCIIGYYKIVNIVPCAIQYILFINFIHSIVCICYIIYLIYILTFSNHEFVSNLQVCFSFVHKFICIIFKILHFKWYHVTCLSLTYFT